MSSNSIMKMQELELEAEEETQSQSTSDEDGDTCDNEIDKAFVDSRSILKQTVTPDQYILQIAATLESNPNVGLTLSDNTCEVFNLSNNQLAKLTALTEHEDVICEIKFDNANSNLIYTACNDGIVKLWDLRTANKSVAQFKGDSRNQQQKQITCFDLSPNNVLLAAGTNLFEGDAFIVFWDIRNYSLQGGYWESHVDDITQVKFHSEDSNKLMSGSVDGLINLYDLSETQEEDALIDSLNTESSIEQLKWIQQQGEDIISCITHTADVQFWRMDDAQPYHHLHRKDIAYGIKRDSKEYIYVVDVHANANQMFILAGSQEIGYKGLSVVGNTTTPAWGFPRDKQLVRASAFNPHTNVLFTGGEKGVLNVWEVNSPEISFKKKK